MDRLDGKQCDWAVNALGNVLVALPRFHAGHLDHARLEDGVLVFHHDWYRRSAIKVPAGILRHLAGEPTILLVAFEAGGNAVEIDLPLRHAARRADGEQ